MSAAARARPVHRCRPRSARLRERFGRAALGWSLMSVWLLLPLLPLAAALLAWLRGEF